MRKKQNDVELNTNETSVMENDESGLNIDVKKQIVIQTTFKTFKNILAYLFLTLIALFSILPFYWMILSSLKTEVLYRNAVPVFFVPPAELQWSNYSAVLQSGDGMFFDLLTNTIIVGVLSTVLGLLVTIVSAFAFAKLEFKGKNLLFSLLLATMMIPGELFTTTNFITVNKLDWANTYTVMIVPFLISVFNIYLLRNAFKQVPDSLYRSAKVDGCSDVKYLIKVMVPLAAPTIVSITLLKFIGTWNSYIWPRLVNNREEWRLLSNWVSGTFTLPGTTSGDTGMTTLKMAAATMVSVPLLIVFICFRKYIMRGVSKSGIKG